MSHACATAHDPIAAPRGGCFATALAEAPEESRTTSDNYGHRGHLGESVSLDMLTNLLAAFGHDEAGRAVQIAGERVPRALGLESDPRSARRAVDDPNFMRQISRAAALHRSGRRIVVWRSSQSSTGDPAVPETRARQSADTGEPTVWRRPTRRKARWTSGSATPSPIADSQPLKGGGRRGRSRRDGDRPEGRPFPAGSLTRRTRKFRRRGWLTPLRCGSQHTPRGHTPCVPERGWRGALPPLTLYHS